MKDSKCFLSSSVHTLSWIKQIVRRPQQGKQGVSCGRDDTGRPEGWLLTSGHGRSLMTFRGAALESLGRGRQPQGVKEEQRAAHNFLRSCQEGRKVPG